MGIAGSQPSSCIPCASGTGCLGINENEEVRLSRGIDRGIRETRRNLANTPKILLLGAGESGKSTIIKQMRILNNVPFTEYERELYRVQVFYNLVGGMRSLLEAMRELPPLEELSAEPASTHPLSSNPLSTDPLSTDPLSATNPLSSNPSSSKPLSPGGSGNAGVGVKRPKPAFLVEPPNEDVKSLGSPGSEGRKELDGVSTLNTNPNYHYHGHDDANSTSAQNSPPTSAHSRIRPLSSVTDNLPSSVMDNLPPSMTDNLSPSSSNHHPSSSSSPPPLLGTSQEDPVQDPDTSHSNSNDLGISNSNSSPNPNETSNSNNPDNANPDTSNATSNANANANPDNTTSTSNDANPEIPLSRSPTRSPSLSLNIFHPGALTQRQHAALLNELHYVPDIRPGEPFPMDYECLLRGLWWGWEGRVSGLDAEGGAGAGAGGAGAGAGVGVGSGGGSAGGGGEGGDILQKEPGVGQYLDRIQSETGIALPDNLTYFFQSPERLSEWFGDDYVPSDEDVLRCRGRTTGIQETVFTLGKSGLGQALRERRKAAEVRRMEGTRAGGQDETGTVGGGGGFGTGTGTGTGTTTTASGTTTIATTSGSGHGQTHTHGGGGGGGGAPPPPPPQLTAPLRIPMGKTRLHLVDVGGQRSERRKWMHCFQDVTAVLFLVGLSGYSQGMLEDPGANQMQDAMALWDGVCSSQWFKQTSLILFLNKKDLFAEKMPKFPIKNYFPDYEGGDTDVAAGMDYFKRRFLRLYAKSMGRRAKPGPTTSATNAAAAAAPKEKGKEREKEKGKGKGNPMIPQRRAVYTHFTTATDTMQLRLVIVAVCDIILRDNLAAAHFL